MDLRCIVCGRQMKLAEKAIMFRKGVVAEDLCLSEGNTLVGFAHMRCYSSAVTSPKLILEQIKKLAKKSKTS